ncbi:MAG: hypothetical protein ACR2P7_09735 [bacterium]
MKIVSVMFGFDADYNRLADAWCAGLSMGMICVKKRWSGFFASVSDPPGALASPAVIARIRMMRAMTAEGARRE